MMQITNIKKIAVTTFILFGLTGCDEKLTYSYLLLNPKVLKKQISNCLAEGKKTKNEMDECVIVMSAADTINKIIEEQQTNPEKFGQRIIDAEMAYAKAELVLQKAQKSVRELGTSNTYEADLLAATSIVTMAKKIADDKREEMNIYLAVMGMNTPE